MIITEPGVTLSDYGLFFECVFLALLLTRQPFNSRPVRSWFIVLFAALGLSAFLGGTSHGFFSDESSSMYALFWNFTLVSIGLVGLAIWMLGISLLTASHFMRMLKYLIMLFFVVYCISIIFINNSYLAAIIFYLPATLFLLFVFIWNYLIQKQSFILSGIIALLLTIAAAAIQQSGYGLHPVWLNHNVLYHLTQAVAILLLFIAARGFVLK